MATNEGAYGKLQEIVELIGTHARREGDDPEEYYGALLRRIDDLCHQAMTQIEGEAEESEE